jgi:cytochrome c-type biogenesis protein CcmE
VKSRARFVIALVLAVGLGGWLAYTSLGGSLSTYVGPSGITAGAGDGTYRLNGIVAKGAPRDAAEAAQGEAGLRFTVVDKDEPATSVPVVYRGSVPDTFRSGREVVLTGEVRGGTFVAERNSLITLCPSKFQAKPDAPAATPGSPTST